MLKNSGLWGVLASLVVLCGCTQTIRIEIRPPNDFVVDCPSAPDARYDRGMDKVVFKSGSMVNLDKSGNTKVSLISKADPVTRYYSEKLQRYPMKWWQGCLTPLFGLGYALWEPYPDPYVIQQDDMRTADQFLRDAAKRIAPTILSNLPTSAKRVGIFAVESDVIGKGSRNSYTTEGNRLLSEYVCNELRSTVGESVDIREYTMGLNWYLKHSTGSLGEGVEARREFIAAFSKQEGLDVSVYGKNYLSPELSGPQFGVDVRGCRLEFDVLGVSDARTVRRFEHVLTIEPNMKARDQLIQLFWPTQPAPVILEEPSLTIEVALERASKRLSGELLSKLIAPEKTVLATYPKPIYTYVGDFGYVTGTQNDKRIVVPNRYGAYVAEKVAQSIMEGAGGQFAIVSRKQIVDASAGIKDRGKTIVQNESSAWIDPDTAPELGRMVGAKLVFRGTMEMIGADLNVTVRLEDMERAVTLAVAEHKINLTQMMAKQFELGNMTP